MDATGNNPPKVITPPITYPRQFGLATLMRASAVRMQAPFSFTVSIKDIITQTSYEWNGD
jgi:hypothetical protein